MPRAVRIIVRSCAALPELPTVDVVPIDAIPDKAASNFQYHLIAMAASMFFMPRRRRVWAILGFAGAVFASPSARADAYYKISETVVGEEVAPRVTRHVTHWSADYYVTDKGVSVVETGARADGRVLPFDQPVAETNQLGTQYVSRFHRLPNGLDVTLDYDSFVLRRHIVETAAHACSVETTSTLKPGHDFFEFHRASDRVPIFIARRTFLSMRCEMPDVGGDVTFAPR